MDDVIYRQDAIDALWKALYDYEDKTEKQFLKSEELNTDDWFRHRIFVQNMSNIDIQTILKLPSAQQWIPCSKRLPHSQEDVLCDDDGRVTIGYYIDEEIGWHDTHSYRIYPTAWMPLPEPYKENDDG